MSENESGTASTVGTESTQAVAKTFPEPCGVIAIITSPDGHVIATVSDFARDGYGGFKLWEAQRIRVRRRILWEVVKAYASPALTNSLTDYLIEQIGQELIGNRRDENKHRLVLRSVGWPDDVREAIERC